MAITPTVSILTNTGAAFMPDSLAWIHAATTGQVGELEEIKCTHNIGLPNSGTWTAPRWPGSAFETVEDMTQAEAFQLPVLVEAAGTLTNTVTMIDSDGTSDTSSALSQVIAADTRTQVYVDINSTATGGIVAEDAFTDTDSTVLTAHELDTNPWLQPWQSGVGSPEIQSNYTEFQAQNGSGTHSAFVEAGTTDYEARIYVNFPSAASSGYANDTANTRGAQGVGVHGILEG